MFLVKWVGYSDNDSTWEAESNLPKELVEAYDAQNGKENNEKSSNASREIPNVTKVEVFQDEEKNPIYRITLNGGIVRDYKRNSIPSYAKEAVIDFLEKCGNELKSKDY